MKIISVINQKGGVGKSTTASALSAGLMLKGFKTLCIDLDAQCNLSFSMGATSAGKTALGVLLGEVSADDAVQSTPNGDVIPASKALSTADSAINETGKEYRLREAIEDMEKKYDYIIIDTPPALSILTINALTASDEIVIPAQADIYSIKGIEQLNETIIAVKKYCNPMLKICGILITRYNSRAILNRDLLNHIEQLASRINTKVFKTTIREAVCIKEAQLVQQDLFKYAPKANVTEDYKNFVEEVLEEN